MFKDMKTLKFINFVLVYTVGCWEGGEGAGWEGWGGGWFGGGGEGDINLTRFSIIFVVCAHLLSLYSLTVLKLPEFPAWWPHWKFIKTDFSTWAFFSDIEYQEITQKLGPIGKLQAFKKDRSRDTG